MFFTEQELTIISLFIGPAIVAAVISGFFSLMLSRRSERLKNITAERSKWREKIRQISEDIQSEDISRLKVALNALKLHINAYGMEDSTDGVVRFEARYVMKDTHIWVLLYQIEHALHEQIRVDDECELLRKYLSLLLKYDWERAKGEVNHSIGITFGWLAMIGSVIGTFIMPLSHVDSFIKVDGKIIFSAVLGIVIILVAGALFEAKVKNKLRQKASSEYNGFKNVDGKIVDVYELLRPYVNYEYDSYILHSALFKSISFLMVNLILTRIWQEWGIEPYSSNIVYIGNVAIYILGAIMVAIENKKTITNEYSYLIEINRLSSKFYGLREK